MGYPQDLIDAVLKAADIVTVISSYINVEKRGRNYLAICPFHDDKNPSLTISKEKQIFKCFVCGTGGNAIGFVQQYDKVPFAEAVRRVAKIVGFSDPRLYQDVPKVKVDEGKQRLYDCINELNAFYQYGLSVPEGMAAKNYLASRNIDESQQKKYGIGYALSNGELTVKYLLSKKFSLKNIEDIGIALAKSEGTSDSNAGRITFPICDPNGQVVGFSARRLDGVHDRKYVNSPEGPLFHKGNILYNYHNVAVSAKRDGYCYVLEGFMDVMALDRAGIPNAVALMGTALTKEQVELLRRLRCELRLCLDGDAAGQTGMMRMCSLLSKADIPFRFVDYGNDLRDPDDILQQEGKDALKKKMETLIDPIDFQLAFYRNTKKLETLDDKKQVLNHFLPFLATLPPGIEQENYLVKLSKITGFELDAIRTLLRKQAAMEETEEGTIYREAMEIQTIHPEKRLLMKLMLAEKTLLHYMLQEKEAIDFFQNFVHDFSNDVYEEIAMSILEYARAHPGEISVGGIIALMQAKENAESDVAATQTGMIAMDDNIAPFSTMALHACLKTIKDERESIAAEQLAKQKISQNKGDKRADGEALNELIAAKRRRWNIQDKPKKPKGGNSSEDFE